MRPRRGGGGSKSVPSSHRCSAGTRMSAENGLTTHSASTEKLRASAVTTAAPGAAGSLQACVRARHEVAQGEPREHDDHDHAAQRGRRRAVERIQVGRDRRVRGLLGGPRQRQAVGQPEADHEGQHRRQEPGQPGQHGLAAPARPREGVDARHQRRQDQGEGEHAEHPPGHDLAHGRDVGAGAVLGPRPRVERGEACAAVARPRRSRRSGSTDPIVARRHRREAHRRRRCARRRSPARAARPGGRSRPGRPAARAGPRGSSPRARPPAPRAATRRPCAEADARTVGVARPGHDRGGSPPGSPKPEITITPSTSSGSPRSSARRAVPSSPRVAPSTDASTSVLLRRAALEDARDLHQRRRVGRGAGGVGHPAARRARRPPRSAGGTCPPAGRPRSPASSPSRSKRSTSTVNPRLSKCLLDEAGRRAVAQRCRRGGRVPRRARCAWW